MRIAYQKSMLNSAQYLLGDYFNIAINGYSMTPESAYKKLLVSKYGDLIAKGNTSVIYGRTGYDLFLDVMDKINHKVEINKELRLNQNTKEFWAGWILAYLQWSTARTFDNIYDFIEFDKIIKMYHPYHEMDERSFVEDIYNNYFMKETNLKRIRKRNSLTQKELAIKSGVSIRTIQMLEQRQNDINNAKALNLFNISKVLHCTIEDLLE